MTVSVSIVSHGQGALVEALLGDLARCAAVTEIVLTLNIPERRAWPSGIRIVENAAPRGFGANHNAAFALASGDHFCVLNPDLRIEADPFPQLLLCLKDPQVGVCAPVVRDPAGRIEDSARAFPTPLAIARKALGGREDFQDENPDWVAGMFMLLRAPVFRQVGGFDEGYRLYYEDVDLCARLRLQGLEVVQSRSVSVVHDARRESRRNPRYFAWHLRSMLRWFGSDAFRALRNQRPHGRRGGAGSGHGHA